MSDIHQQAQRIKDRFFTDGQPDRDKTQKTLQEEFETRLLFRTPDQTIESIINGFAARYEPQLNYLGNARQDDMLREAMSSTGVDLSQWIGKE